MLDLWLGYDSLDRVLDLWLGYDSLDRVLCFSEVLLIRIPLRPVKSGFDI